MAQKQQRLWTKTLSEYWQSLHGNRVRFFVSLGLITIAVILGAVYGPYLLANLIEDLSSIGDETFNRADFWSQARLYIVVLVGGTLTWRIFGYYWLKMMYDLPIENARRVFEHMLTRSYSFFTNTFGGSLTNQFNQFKWTANELIFILFFDLYTAALRAVFYFIVLTLLLPSIGIAMLAWIGLYFAVVLTLVNKKSPLSRKAAKARSITTGYFADTITNIFTVKDFAQSKRELARFEKSLESEKQAVRKNWIFAEHIFTIQGLLGVLFEVTVLLLTLNAVLNGSIAVSTVILAQFYLINIVRDVRDVSRVIQQLEKKFNDAHEMVEIFEKPIVVKDPINPEALKNGKGKIDFKNVTFMYSDGEDKVFKDFNLKIQPGQKIGLVGHSGSGKSTLVKLLLRYEDIKNGEILIDEQNIANLLQEDLRSKIATVPQEPILFHRSIADNIRYSNPDVSEKEVIKAAKQANAHDFIKELPEGYDTLVGERGIKLSGGEKQRVAIARAMLSKAPILLLDEATSALDSKSENLIQIALDRLMKNRTTIVIAHRLSTIRMMDRIVVMEKGEIKEDGTHDELLELNGQYAQLWAHQAGGFLQED